MIYAYAALAAVQLAGSYFSAQNIKETARINKQISDMNAEYAELDAYDAEIEGVSSVAKYQSTVDQTISTQRAEMAAADIDLSYGSAASIEEETKFLAELNKLELLHQAQDRVHGYEREAFEHRFSGTQQYGLARAKAYGTMLQGVTSAGSTGLSGYKAYKGGL